MKEVEREQVKCVQMSKKTLKQIDCEAARVWRRETITQRSLRNLARRVARLAVASSAALSLALGCEMTGTVLELAQRHTAVKDERLMTVRVTGARGCGREIETDGRDGRAASTVLTVETNKHGRRVGDVVELRSLERTPHGFLLVTVKR